MAEGASLEVLGEIRLSISDMARKIADCVDLFGKLVEKIEGHPVKVTADTTSFKKAVKEIESLTEAAEHEINERNQILSSESTAKYRRAVANVRERYQYDKSIAAGQAAHYASEQEYTHYGVSRRLGVQFRQAELTQIGKDYEKVHGVPIPAAELRLLATSSKEAAIALHNQAQAMRDSEAAERRGVQRPWRIGANAISDVVGGRGMGGMGDLVAGMGGMFMQMLLMRPAWALMGAVGNLPQMVEKQIEAWRNAQDIQYWKTATGSAEPLYRSIGGARSVFSHVRGADRSIPAIIGKMFEKNLPGSADIETQSILTLHFANAMAVLAASGQGMRPGWEFLSGDMKGLPEAAREFAILFDSKSGSRYLQAKKQWGGSYEVQRELAHILGVNTKFRGWEAIVQESLGKYDEVPGATTGRDIAKAISNIATRAAPQAKGQWSEFRWDPNDFMKMLPDAWRTSDVLGGGVRQYMVDAQKLEGTSRQFDTGTPQSWRKYGGFSHPNYNSREEFLRGEYHINPEQADWAKHLLGGLHDPTKLDFGLVDDWKKHMISGTEKNFMWSSLPGLAEQMQLMASGGGTAEEQLTETQKQTVILENIDKKLPGFSGAPLNPVAVGGHP